MEVQEVIVPILDGVKKFRRLTDPTDFSFKTEISLCAVTRTGRLQR